MPCGERESKTEVNESVLIFDLYMNHIPIHSFLCPPPNPVARRKAPFRRTPTQQYADAKKTGTFRVSAPPPLTTPCVEESAPGRPPSFASPQPPADLYLHWGFTGALP